MGKLIEFVLGGGDKPKVSAEPVTMVQNEQKKAKKSRAQVLSTVGGIAGQEISAGGVIGSDQNDTLFGN